MQVKRCCIILVLILFGVNTAHSQENRTEIFVDFRVNSTRIDSGYKDNASRISELVSFLQRIQTDSTTKIVNISFCGAASPEGSYEWNRKLAEGRLKALEGLVRGNVEIPDSIITYDDSYIPWDNLASRVSESDMPHKHEILSIIGRKAEIVEYHSGRTIDSRILRLQRLDGGKAWREMLRRFFSPMRNACVVFVTFRTEPLPRIEPVIAEVDSVYTIEWTPTLPILLDSIRPIQQTSAATETRKPFNMAVRSNLLEDVLLIPNIGIEFYLGKQWSIGLNWKYAWWNSDRKHNYWRIYGGDINIRKYFGGKAKGKTLLGHHIGIYAQAVTYDFELGGKGIMGGVPGGNMFDKLNYGVGVEYGYSLPIAKRLNMDFSIGFGYLGGQYQEYKPVDDCYVWQATKHRHYWGPTKAEISLVWLLGRDNFNVKKGGRR